MKKEKRVVEVRQSLWDKIKASVKAVSFTYLLLASTVLMIFGFITPGQFLSYTMGIATSFWGIREYGKRHWKRYRDDYDV